MPTPGLLDRRALAKAAAHDRAIRQGDHLAAAALRMSFNRIGRDALLDKIVPYGGSALFRELLVVLITANAIGVAIYALDKRRAQ